MPRLLLRLRALGPDGRFGVGEGGAAHHHRAPVQASTPRCPLHWGGSGEPSETIAYASSLPLALVSSAPRITSMLSYTLRELFIYTDPMAFEDFKSKDSVVIVYTGEGKGKTSASLGLLMRALGAGWRVAYIQFIKLWDVSEHQFIRDIMPIYGDRFDFYKGGLGFFDAGEMSGAGSDDDHKQFAQSTYEFARQAVTSGEYDLVICDEINNAVHDNLLDTSDLTGLLDSRATKTSLCLTGRDFPDALLNRVDIATNMTKLKHHFDDKYLANKGIDY